ncbi:MAG: response regulator [Vicinamibacterales bacterium]
MLAVICDDDPSARFVIKRLLTQHLGCSVVECADGLEALARLEQGDADLLVLDVQMPQLDGVEVLEAVRGAPALKGLPVVMVSSERRESIIRRVAQLGIDGYVLKPLRADKVMGVLEPLRARLAARQHRPGAAASSDCGLGPDNPAMLVDGSLDYRHFFLSQAQPFGPVIEAATGAAALALYRESPVRLIFLGQELGIMRPELLVPKLRAIAAGQPLCIVEVSETAGDPGVAPLAGADAQLRRTFLPDVFRTEFRRFVAAKTDDSAAASPLLGNLRQEVASAARQVFGMMLEAELEPVEGARPASEARGATATLDLPPDQAVALRIFGSTAALTTIAARMLAMTEDQVGEDDVLSSAGELANLIGGRLHAILDERGVNSQCSLPTLVADAAAWMTEDHGAQGVRTIFRLKGTAVEVWLSLHVTPQAAPA